MNAVLQTQENKAKDVTNTTPKKSKSHPRVEIVRQNLRMACAYRGRINYSEIARDAGLSRNILSQFLAGKKSIGYENLLSICDVLDVPIGLLDHPDGITTAKINAYKAIIKGEQ